MEKNQLILSVKDLNIKFNLRGKVLHAIRGIDLDIYHGEVLAIVGESGSGKSVFTKSFMGLLDANGSITSGTIDYYGADDGKPIRLSDLKKEKDWLKVRGHEIAMIMQDPMTSLNPLKTIGDQIMEAVELHQHLKGKAAREKTLEYLRDVGIADPEVRFAQYPHEFSGGMRQRVVIAIAVACNPQILICDEPTTALDVTIQAQILQLLKEMQVKYNLTIVLITHDLGVVANIADRVAVMYAGDIVEIGTSDEIYYDPRHPYTWALLSSMPQMGIKGEDLFNIQVSVSMGIMITYGSYVKPDVDLNKAVNQIEIFDTGVALLAGAMIIPAVYVFSGTEGMSAGPSLMFVSLPKVFNAMGKAGVFVGILFFVTAIFATLTSCISVLESITANCMEIFHTGRKKTVLVLTVIYLTASAIIALGYSIFYFEVQLPNGSAAQLLDIMDYVSNSVMMPFIALLSTILIGWVITPDYVIDEMQRSGETFRRKKLYRVMIRYVAPVMMLVLFLQSTGILA